MYVSNYYSRPFLDADTFWIFEQIQDAIDNLGLANTEVWPKCGIPAFILAAHSPDERLADGTATACSYIDIAVIQKSGPGKPGAKLLLACIDSHDESIARENLLRKFNVTTIRRGKVLRWKNF